MHFRWNLGKQTIFVFAVCIGLIVFCNVYFLFLHSKSQTPSLVVPVESNTLAGRVTRNSPVQANIERRWTKIRYDELPAYEPQLPQGITAPPTPEIDWLGLIATSSGLTDVWEMARQWVGPRQVYSPAIHGLRAVIRAMATTPILEAGVGKGGTQLKLTLTLSGGQEVLFKPMRYERDAVFTDSPYSGADRHNGEIVAFHLSRIFDFPWVPIAVGREINLRTEVLPVASESLRRTFLSQEKNLCFYGVCYYCNPRDPACAKGDVIEGALILYLPHELNITTHLHPWRRTYSKKKLEPWRLRDDYCNAVVLRSRKYREGPRLLDLIDIAVFDFLIGNADRHHYDTFTRFNDSIVIMLDNGKSFGDPDHDETTILAPLYQCCRIRKSTWAKLRGSSSESLSLSLYSMLKEDPLTDLLNHEYYLAINRRRLKVLDVISYCLEKRGQSAIL